MENIRKAIERVKDTPATGLQSAGQVDTLVHESPSAAGAPQLAGSEYALNSAHLENNRIISHDITDPRSKSFDMLRTQVLQSMAMKSWQILGVTSPTAGCGKSMIATNLALSVARQPGRSVLLIDMDLQKPQVSRSLGLNSKRGLVSVLEGQISLRSALTQVRINDEKLLVLPCESPRINSSEWMTSRPMAAVWQEIKRDFRGWTIILDLPPMLLSDDVLSILPQVDCVLFVATVGTSTIREIRECTKHLESASIVRVVLNKSTDAITSYYSRYGHYLAPELNK
jgi:protein-tyrosine kinase